jgi:methyl-accepting chemotaxis protein
LNVPKLSHLSKGGLVVRGRRHDENGQAASSALLLIVVLVVLVIAVVLLQRTASTATAINKKASVISKTGVGINDNTTSILQLTHTNALATSILHSATPLQGDLSQIVNLGNSINGLATTINQSATTINSTATAINNSAGAINSTAVGINSTAGQILGVATTIQVAVAMINSDLTTTDNVATLIRGDTDAIVGSGASGLAGALHEAGCINHDLGGNAGTTCP